MAITEKHVGFDAGTSECYVTDVQPIPTAHAYDVDSWVIESHEPLTKQPTAKDYETDNNGFTSAAMMPTLYGGRVVLKWTGTGAEPAYPTTCRIEVIPSYRDGYAFYACSARFVHYHLTYDDGVLVRAVPEPITVAWQSFDQPALSASHHARMLAVLRSFLYRDIQLGVEGTSFMSELIQGVLTQSPIGVARTDAI